MEDFGTALVIAIPLLLIAVGLVRGNLVGSSRAVRPRVKPRRTIVSYINRLRLMPRPEVPGGSAEKLETELKRLLMLIAVNPAHRYPVEGPMRTGWEQLVQDRGQYNRICRNLFTRHASVKHERVGRAMAGNIDGARQLLASAYTAEFAETPASILWSDNGVHDDVLFLSTDLSPVRHVSRKDGEHLKTDYYGGMGER
jgi:hypothetical protein